MNEQDWQRDAELRALLGEVLYSAFVQRFGGRIIHVATPDEVLRRDGAPGLPGIEVTEFVPVRSGGVA